MKKTELKKVLKPLIKECIKEALFEEGVLSNIISEVVSGLNVIKQPIVEQKQDSHDLEQLQLEERRKRVQRIDETRKKMLDVINKDAYNGVNIFEGTAPLGRGGDPSDTMTPQGPLSGVDPNDTGVDISGFMGNKHVWKALTGGN
tara:strand:+ start:2837 stop:3271 length:435 start_codon:yes stop_codon:yes gene_type:complete